MAIQKVRIVLILSGFRVTQDFFNHCGTSIRCSQLERELLNGGIITHLEEDASLKLHIRMSIICTAGYLNIDISTWPVAAIDQDWCKELELQGTIET